MGRWAFDPPRTQVKSSVKPLGGKTIVSHEVQINIGTERLEAEALEA